VCCAGKLGAWPGREYSSLKILRCSKSFRSAPAKPAHSPDTVLELRNLVQQEMETNPVLEELPDEPVPMYKASRTFR